MIPNTTIMEKDWPSAHLMDWFKSSILPKAILFKLLPLLKFLKKDPFGK